MTLFFAFRKEDLLKGNSSEERYNYFDNYSSTEEFYNLVDKMYPLLKPRLDRILKKHIINYNNLKMRAEKDKTDFIPSLFIIL